MTVKKLSLLAAACLFAGGAARAADEGPAYETGPVWVYTMVQTKDGHFDDYVKWLATDWKRQQEAVKASGRILDYKVLVVDSPRNGEPDLILAAKVANMAAFDRKVSDEYKFFTKIAGSLAKSNKEQADRGSIRTLMGMVTTRELELK